MAIKKRIVFNPKFTDSVIDRIREEAAMTKFGLLAHDWSIGELPKENKNMNNKNQENIQDLTENFKESFGVTKNYKTTAERYLAEYAATVMINKYGTLVRDMKNASESPGTETIPIDVASFTSVYQDVIAMIVVERDGIKYEGIIQGVYIPNSNT